MYVLYFESILEHFIISPSGKKKMTGLDKVMILSLVAIGAADYSCYCNYSVEKHVYPTTSNSSRPLASLYEFDCKPSFPTPNLPPPWAAIQYKHQVRRRKLLQKTRLCNLQRFYFSDVKIKTFY